MISAILLSGGVGSRMGASTPKQYLPLAGRPMALHSFRVLLQSIYISEVIVACEERYQDLFPGAKYADPGKRRQDSLFNALKQVSPNTDFVLIHDAARPLLNEDDMENVVEAAKEFGAAALATPVKVTIKQADPDHMVISTLNRDALFDIHTPQVLRKEILHKGFVYVHKNNLTVTDDVSLAELVGYPVKLVLGSYENIKITTPEDLALAEYSLRERARLT